MFKTFLTLILHVLKVNLSGSYFQTPVGTKGFLNLNLSTGKGTSHPGNVRTHTFSLTGTSPSTTPPRELRGDLPGPCDPVCAHARGYPNHSTGNHPPLHPRTRDLPQNCRTQSALKWNGFRTLRRRQTSGLWVSPGSEQAAGRVADSASSTGNYKNARIKKIESVTLLFRLLL